MHLALQKIDKRDHIVLVMVTWVRPGIKSEDIQNYYILQTADVNNYTPY